MITSDLIHKSSAEVWCFSIRLCNLITRNSLPGLQIIVCDGTWRQARRLDKRFGPSVRRVRLTDERLAAHVDR